MDLHHSGQIPTSQAGPAAIPATIFWPVLSKGLEPSLFGLLAHLLSKSRKHSRGHCTWHRSAISDHGLPASPPGTFRTWSGQISGRNTKKSQEGMGLVTQPFRSSPENRRVSGKGSVISTPNSLRPLKVEDLLRIVSLLEIEHVPSGNTRYSTNVPAARRCPRSPLGRKCTLVTRHVMFPLEG